MKNLVLGSGVVAALIFGCGKSNTQDDSPARGGSSAGGAGATSGGDAGDAGDDAGPSVEGGATSKGGSTAQGGAAVPLGGSANGGKGGAPSMSGSADGGKLAGGADGLGGSDEPAGAPSTGGAPNTGGTPSSGGASFCEECQPLEQCWNESLCVAKSIALGAGFSIDATEVTRGQYTAWLATDPSSDGQRDDCEWNASFTPDPTCMLKASVCNGSDCAQHPQPCVDFCDAAAYCEAVGKRLCGGVAGGSVAPNDASDPAVSQWHNACTSGGSRTLVYGDAIDPGTCNDATANASTTVEVGSMSDCQSPDSDYAGVFDLSGNVWEWEDNCRLSADQPDICNPRGGSFGVSAAAPNCTQQLPVQSTEAGDNIGFRCCSD